jgi:Zn-dependent peptidase ImmA (M78 family)/DNA-binding XRE family transcriptional regulator
MLISGERVRQARELKGITQSALAKCAGVSQAAVAQVEAGEFIASDDLCAAIARCLSQPIRFFQQEPAQEIDTGSLLFRSHASMSKRDMNASYRYAQTAFELFMRMRRRVRAIPVKIVASAGCSPQAAAQQARAALGLEPDAAVPHLLNLLEWHGVIAVVVPDLPSRDAFSVWVEELPIMALSANRSGDRARLSVSHELGHLILHKGVSRLEVDESEADDFAAEFLMPAEAMIRAIRPPFTLSSLAALKPHWRVSIQALIRRANDLEIISHRQYRYLFEQLSSVGWRMKEPVPIEPEKPRAFRQIAEFLYGDPPDIRSMADDHSLQPEFLREALRHYAPKMELAGPADSKIVTIPKKRVKQPGQTIRPAQKQ